ncbi:MAG: universal stress protein [Solirubrobacteraceae bacterium]
MPAPTQLICFDGSDRAEHAIAVAARLFPGASAKVLHVWEPVEHIVARYAVLAPYLGEELGDAGASAEKQSAGVAQKGADLAKAAGLDASAHNVTLTTSVWQAVIDASKSLDADLIITGTRSLHGVQEMLAGTLSHSLLQHSRVALLAIPMAD